MTVTDFVYDPFSPEVMADPLPFYEVMREHFPVYYSPKYDAFFLSRFEDAWEFLSVTGDVFVASESTVMQPDVLLNHNDGQPVPDPPTEPFGFHVFYSEPIYNAVRQAHSRPFRPGAVAKLEGFVREQTRTRLDELLPRGQFDLVQEYGGIVSAATVCHMFHLPISSAKMLLETVNASARTDPEGGGFVETEEQIRMHDLIETVAQDRRAEGADGSWPLIDGMLNLKIDGRRLTNSEISGNLGAVVAGGTETLPKIVGHGLMELWRRPDQLAEVRLGLPESAPVVFEEMTRFCGPAQWFGRTARVDTKLCGQKIRAGQRVIYLTQSAGRDEREFEHANEFRWNRPIPRSLAFGYGQHFCVGVHVARLEGRILVEEFLSRVAQYEIDLDGAERRPSSFQWGYSRIPVAIKRLA